MINLTETEFSLINCYVRDHFGLEMENKRYLVEIRLNAELQRTGCKSFSEYWQLLQHDAGGRLMISLSNCLTTNYTFFCREENHFSYIRTELLPKVRKPLSVWCAGCATGQESYTLAMLLAESRELGRLAYDYHILATDLSAEAIETAQTGIYPRAEYDRLPSGWQKRYCLLQPDNHFIITTRIRDTVRYIRQNLMNVRPGSGNFDMVFCRNVLIYFGARERAVVVRTLVEALRPGGFLFIGHAESLINCETGLEYIKPAIYRKPEEPTNVKK